MQMRACPGRKGRGQLINGRTNGALGEEKVYIHGDVSIPLALLELLFFPSFLTHKHDSNSSQ